MKIRKLKFLTMVLFLTGFFVLNSANTCEGKKEEKTEQTAEDDHPNNDEHPQNEEHPSNDESEHPDN